MTVFRKVKRLITAEAYEAENYTFLSPSSLHPATKGPSFYTALIASSSCLLAVSPQCTYAAAPSSHAMASS
jgi:hypothetical protein